MGSAAPVRFRCPDCVAPVARLEGLPACSKCGRAFAPEEGVWDLRRAGLEKGKNGLTSLEEVNSVTVE